MWPFPSQLGLDTLVPLFVTTRLLVDVEGDLLECKHVISSKYEALCTKYNKYIDSRCRTFFETAKCLVEKACKDCSAEEAKQYAKWKADETESTLRKYCYDEKSYFDKTKEMSKLCSSISINSPLTDITSMPMLGIFIGGGSVVLIVVLLLASLAIWFCCCRPDPKSTTGRTAYQSAKKSKKSKSTKGGGGGGAKSSRQLRAKSKKPKK